MSRLLVILAIIAACLVVPAASATGPPGASSPAQAQSCEWFPSNSCTAPGSVAPHYPYYAGQLKANLNHTPPDDGLRRRALGLAGKTAWVIPEPALRPSARNGFSLPVQQHAGVKEVMARSGTYGAMTCRPWPTFHACSRRWP